MAQTLLSYVDKVASEFVDLIEKPTAFIPSPFSPCSEEGPFGFRPFFAHRPSSYRTQCGISYYTTSQKPILKKPASDNAQEFDRDFYDRFGHSEDMNDYVSNEPAFTTIERDMIDMGKTQAPAIAEAKIVETTEIAPATAAPARPWFKEREMYEKELGLPPLPVHLRFINTQAKNFNLNDPSFNLYEYMEIRRRDKLVDELKAKKAMKA